MRKWRNVKKQTLGQTSMYDRHPWEEGRGKDISMKVNVYVASAFSKDDMGGNRAGVVLGEIRRKKPRLHISWGIRKQPFY